MNCVQRQYRSRANDMDRESSVKSHKSIDENELRTPRSVALQLENDWNKLKNGDKAVQDANMMYMMLMNMNVQETKNASDNNRTSLQPRMSRNSSPATMTAVSTTPLKPLQKKKQQKLKLKMRLTLPILNKLSSNDIKEDFRLG